VNETILPPNAELSDKLDLLLTKMEGIEARLDTLEAGPMGQLAAPLNLAMSGMTDDMVKGLVAKVATLAEVVLDPGVLALLERVKDPELLATLERVMAPKTLEGLRGLAGALDLVQSGMTDEMVSGLVRKVGVLAELILDPFVLDALERAARALKAGQSEYPDVKVPPVGGVFAALRSANDPDTRRVMAFAMAVMRNLGHEFS
jgi:hypothetical protein